MRITTKIVLDIERGRILAHDWYDYDGPVEKCCGGSAIAPQQEQAATQSVQEQQELMQMLQQYSGASTPFWMNQLQNGLPFMNNLQNFSSGTLAQSFQPAQASLNRSLAGLGQTMPSGMAQQLQTDLGAQEGEAFDANTVQNLEANYGAKEQAATALSPFAPAAAATSAGSSVSSAQPVQTSGIGNIIGGAVSGLFNGAGAAGGFAKLF
jgi:hypothetical protein